ncbi:MAG: hypothetical protein DMG13_11870 [Acidobacteria bacterium]|nr:MAG: hypothetical protein DMG13_11870 [Acidobacteriota bacterium]
MKRFLLWSFERGSKQYDVICAAILAFIFLTPPSVFHDRPDSEPSPAGPIIRATSDDGHTVFTVKVEPSVLSTPKATEQVAVDRLKAWLGAPVTVSHTEPVYDGTGALVAYSIWIDQR